MHMHQVVRNSGFFRKFVSLNDPVSFFVFLLSRKIRWRLCKHYLFFNLGSYRFQCMIICRLLSTIYLQMDILYFYSFERKICSSKIVKNFTKKHWKLLTFFWLWKKKREIKIGQINVYSLCSNAEFICIIILTSRFTCSNSTIKTLKAICRICSKLTAKTADRRQQHFSGAFNVSFESTDLTYCFGITLDDFERVC